MNLLVGKNPAVGFHCRCTGLGSDHRYELHERRTLGSLDETGPDDLVLGGRDGAVGASRGDVVLLVVEVQHVLAPAREEGYHLGDIGATPGQLASADLQVDDCQGVDVALYAPALQAKTPEQTIVSCGASLHDVCVCVPFAVDTAGRGEFSPRVG